MPLIYWDYVSPNCPIYLSLYTLPSLLLKRINYPDSYPRSVWPLNSPPPTSSIFQGSAQTSPPQRPCPKNIPSQIAASPSLTRNLLNLVYFLLRLCCYLKLHYLFVILQNYKPFVSKDLFALLIIVSPAYNSLVMMGAEKYLLYARTNCVKKSTFKTLKGKHLGGKIVGLFFTFSLCFPVFLKFSILNTL